MADDLEALIKYCKSNERICPMPDHWNQLWEMLPNRSRVGSSWKPSLPLILAAWDHSSPITKMDRLEEHLRWADAHGALKTVDVFLRSLHEDDWAYLN